MFRQFYPAERAPDTHSIVGWVGPTTGLDSVEKNYLSLYFVDSRPEHLLS
jgi:hypothetical protein